MSLALGLFLVGAGIAVLVLGTGKVEAVPEEPPIIPEEEVPVVREINVIIPDPLEVFVSTTGF